MKKIFSQKYQFIPRCKLEPVIFFCVLLAFARVLLLRITVWMLLAFNLICEFDRFLITPRVSQNSYGTLEKIITSPPLSKSMWKLLLYINVSKPPLGP